MAKNRSFDPVRGVLVARTNVAAGGIKNLAISQNAAGAVNVPGIVYGHLYGTSAANDLFFMRIPALPNGKLIIALHGRGLSLFQMAYLSAQFPPVWQELERLGYTILFPNLGGDTWASSSSMLLLKQLKESVCSEFRLDPCVYLWGYSMGGMVALSAAQKSTFGDGNVAAIYLAAPVCDLEAVLAANPSFTEISTIYPLASDRVAANPIKQSVANFAAMPVVFVGATDDATVSKVQNADAMSALLAPITTTSVISTTGGHGSANQFRALDSVGTFQLNQ
jgi:predicted esterase